MNTVIYDPEDLEPITIVDIPRSFIKALDEGRCPFLRFPIHQPLVPVLEFLEIPVSSLSFTVAEIRFERFRYRETAKWMAFAMNPEICLLLKSVFLPGQSQAVNDERAKAMAKGFLNGFRFAVGAAK